MEHTHFSTKWRRTRSSLRLFVAAGSLALASVSASAAAGQTTLPSTPQALLATDPRVFVTILKTSRPQPVSLEDRRLILASLPAAGVMTGLARKERNKLTALGPLLRAAERDAVYDVRVVDTPFARIGVYERTALLISAPALGLLSGEDLRAQVAHEIGHEYFTTEYEGATKASDRRRLKDLELMCDAVGIVMLQELGMDPSRLMASVETVTVYNRRTSQVGIDESNYPTLDERWKFAATVQRWIQKR